MSPTQLADDKKGISAKVVMHHFARGEVRSLDQGSDATFAAVVAKLRTMMVFAPLNDRELAWVISKMTRMLQSADLTINFDPYAWFAQPNTYKTYTQMYERGRKTVVNAKGKTQVRLAGNAKNNSSARDQADTAVSFGPNIGSKAMQGVARFMQTGGKAAKDVIGEVIVTNPTFNEKAKQIFAGLNYGRRPNGSTTLYGAAHLVLDDHFKHNAIYYMGDTFLPGASHTTRTTYGMLLSVILHATPMALNEIVQSCFRNSVLGNTSAGDLLLEAHIYDVVPFRGGVRKMVIDRFSLQCSWASVIVAEPNYDPEKHGTWETVHTNMKDFCNRNKIKLVILD